MPTSRQLFCAALAAGCLFSTTPAEARFGKARGSRSSDSRSSGEPRAGRENPRVHDATPVGQDSDDASPGKGGGHEDRGPRRVALVPSFVWVSASSGYQRRDFPRLATREPAHPMMVRLGLEGHSLRRDGKALGLHLGLEERRWGLSTRMTALMLAAEDGASGTDQIHLGEVHVTFSPAAHERGRLRLEAGLAAARAPDVIFVGPSVALSFERCLLGSLDVESRLQWVPVPHLQLDGQVGLALHLGALSLRGGWRGLLLDDRGLVDKVVHREVLSGPFVGVGLNF